MLVSGSGSNLQALINACADSDYGARIVVVVSDRPGVRALDRAREAGIPVEIVPWSGDRDEFTVAICERVESYGAEAMVLAGFMRVLGTAAIRRFPGRVLNIHPSLLPSFPGIGAVDQALAYGAKVTGVSVHFVDEQVDHGPIVSQESIPVLPGDDAESLHQRIQKVEHRLYPEAVRALATGILSIDDRKVVWG